MMALGTSYYMFRHRPSVNGNESGNTATAPVASHYTSLLPLGAATGSQGFTAASATDTVPSHGGARGHFWTSANVGRASNGPGSGGRYQRVRLGEVEQGAKQGGSITAGEDQNLPVQQSPGSASSSASAPGLEQPVDGAIKSYLQNISPYRVIESLDITVVLKIWNTFTCLIHLAAAVGTLYVCIVKDRFGIGWQLKRDGILVGNSTEGLPIGFSSMVGSQNIILSTDGGFNEVVNSQVSPVPGFPLFGGCLQDSKFYAQPNEMIYESSSSSSSSSSWLEDESLAMYVYAQRTGVKIYLAPLVISFFALSFLFQIMVVTDAVGPVYRLMFPRLPAASQVARGSSMVTPGGYVCPHYSECNSWYGGTRLGKYLVFNVFRYVEYSISASIMIVAISLLAGITDLDLILCIVTLTASCMITGLAAELFLRICQVMDNVSRDGIAPNVGKARWEFAQGYLNKQLPPEQLRVAKLWEEFVETVFPLEMIRRFSWYTAVIMHCLGWVCILVPWYIIWSRYSQWFSMEGPSRECAANFLTRWNGWSNLKARALIETMGEDHFSRKPPDFVQGIIISQIAIFLIFGFVQVYQFRNPENRVGAELMYITLSATAKLFLGAFIAWGLLA